MLELLQAAFDTLVDRGHDPANAYFECVHELTLITDLVHRYGVDGMRGRISPTAAYGGLTRGPRIIDAAVRARLNDLLDEIEDGRFATEFLARHGEVADLARREAASPLAATGRRLQPRLDALATNDGPAPSDEETGDDR
jgi:ketol-acid reductoisomerase